MKIFDETVKHRGIWCIIGLPPQQSGMLEKGNMVILNFYHLSTKAIDFSNQLLIFERQAFTFKRDELRHGNLMHPPKATTSK